MTQTNLQTENLKIWNSLEKTDPRYTREYKGPGGFTGTSINAAYAFKRATELFGPVGKGWGYEVLEDRFDIGGPLATPEDIPVIMGQVSTVKIRLWYMLDGERREIEGYGHTPYVYANKYGIQTDWEATKKSLTDAIKKCLSMLGVAADIFLGEFEDYYYVAELREQYELERSDDKIEKKAEQMSEYREWKDRNLQLITTATNMNELQKLYGSAIRKADLRKDEDFKVKITKAKDIRKGELEEKAK